MVLIGRCSTTQGVTDVAPAATFALSRLSDCAVIRWTVSADEVLTLQLLDYCLSRVCAQQSDG